MTGISSTLVTSAGLYRFRSSGLTPTHALKGRKRRPSVSKPRPYPGRALGEYPPHSGLTMSYTFCMELRLTPETEAKLNELARRTRRATDELLGEAVDHLVAY